MSVVEEVLSIAPGAPVPLPPGLRPWRVERGEVEVYLTNPARRRLVAVVGEGRHVFPLPTNGAVTLNLVTLDAAELVQDESGLADSADAWVGWSCERLRLPPPVLPPHDLVGGVAEYTIALETVFEERERVGDAELAARLAAGRGAEASEEGGTISAALAWIAESLALPIQPQAFSRDAGFDETTRVARLAGLRAARIILSPGWWRDDLGPLVLRHLDGERAQPALWRRGAYRSPNDDRIDPAQFDSLAWRVYPPLGDDVGTLRGMARHVSRWMGDNPATLVTAGLAAALLGLIVPLATGWIFGDIVPSGAAGLLVSVALALLVAAFVNAALAVVRARAAARVGGLASVALSAGVHDRVLRLPARFFKTIPAGDFNQRLDSLDVIRGLVTNLLLTAGLSLLFSTVYLALLFVYEWRMALAALVLTLVYVASLTLSRSLQAAPLREAAERDGRLAGFTFEILEGLPKLRTAAAELRFLARWSRAYGGERAAAARAGRVANHFAAFGDGWQVVTLIGLFAAAALLAQGEVPPGRFIAVLAAFAIFQGAFTGFCEALLAILNARPLAERVRPIVTAEAETGVGRANPGRLTGDIQASGLTFTYGAAMAPLINGLNFELKSGEHLAIVGGSGSGKSTLLRLLLGFERPSSGSLTYDGQELSSLDPTLVRAQIGVVLQSSQLFAGSIYENIRGASGATLEQCIQAAEQAGLAGDLKMMPMGLHTPITEGAGTLSGGQRQRILIARALAASPPILFFDEATSALDNATQAIVARTLDALKVTRITIAHRLSTVRHADRICVLKGGRFAETGRFEELMAKDGAFAALAKRQLLGD
jgi:NHLM bacteriocin system ABC transporter ATP-binding protein